LSLQCYIGGVEQRSHSLARKTTRAGPIVLEDALAVLRAHKAELAAIGVIHAGVFGSVARGTATADSDLDVLVVLDDLKVVTIYDYCGVRLAISDLFGGRADVVERKSLRPRLKDRILAEVVDAF
jgi:hypothetical protein